VDWLWSTKPHSATVDSALLAASPGAQAVARFAFFLSQTPLGRMIIRNRFLKTIGKRILKLIGAP